ncbi:hypothetical protein FALCPG4_015894 [Fusarium falciforme]
MSKFGKEASQGSSQVLSRSLCFYSPPPNNASPEYIAESGSTPGQRNYPHSRVTVPISDIRGREQEFHLSQHSFAALPNAFSSHVDFTLPDDISHKYLPWVKDLLRQTVPRCTEVVVFDHCLRKASETKTPNRQVRKIHIDQSLNGAFARAFRHLPEAESARIKSGEASFRIINVWKPVGQPVSDHPLTFMNFQSLESRDLVPVRHTYPGYVGETYALRYNPNQRFHYWGDMTPNDVLLLQCFDSVPVSNEGWGWNHVQCAHGSFELAEDGFEPCTRESIEVRCVVVVE